MANNRADTAKVSIIIDGKAAILTVERLEKAAVKGRKQLDEMAKSGHQNKAEYKALSQTIEELNAKISTQTVEMEKQKIEMKRLRDQSADYKAEVKDLSAQQSKLTEQIKKEKEATEPLTQRIKELAKSKKELQSENKKTTASYDKEVKSIENTQTKMAKLQERMDALSSKGKADTSRYGELSAEYKTLEKTLKTSEASVAKFKNEIGGLTVKMQENDKETEDLKRSYNEMLVPIKKYEAESAKLKVHMDELRAAGKLNTAEYKKVSASYVSMTNNIRALNSESKKLDNQMKEMSKTGVNSAAYKAQKTYVESIEAAANQTRKDMELVDKSMKSLSNATLRQLQQSLQATRRLMQNLTADDPQMKRLIKDYKALDNQIASITGQWRQQDGAILSVIKRLTAYVGVYGAFNFVTSQLEMAITKNLEFSDVLADVQKTTGLSKTAIAELNEEISKIDTRTAIMSMHNLAYEAGKLGITGVENVRQFTAAANQIMVALGDELGGEQAITELMKINQVLGVTTEQGIESALLSTGSAMNELSQSSTAVSEKMVDFTSRLSGIAKQSRISMSELIGLAGASDALKQEVEVSATAFNKFFVTLQTNTREVAQAVGISDELLTNMIAQGQTMEAGLLVLESLAQKGGLKDIAPLMKNLGSDGARLTAVLSTMSSNVDFVREMVERSNHAFKEATSVTEEYNVKNENAAALFERIGNAIEKNFVNSGFVEWLESVLRGVLGFTDAIYRNYEAIRTWTSVILSVTAAWISYSKAVAIAAIADTRWRTLWPATLTLLGSLQARLTALFVTVKAFNFSSLATGIAGLGKAIKVLFAGINPIAAAIAVVSTAVVGAIAYFGVFRDRVTEAAKAVGDFTSNLVKEKLELVSLENAITSTTEKTKERADLISELNTKYGKYLDFVVTESNYLDNQEYIYKKLNAEISRTLALKMREQAIERTADRYGEEVSGASTDVYSALTERLGESSATRVLSMVESAIQKNIDQTEDVAWMGLLDSVEEAFKGVGKETRAKVASAIYDDFRDYFEVQQKIDKELSATQRQFDAQAEASKKLSTEATKELFTLTLAGIESQGGIANASVESLQHFAEITNSIIESNPDSLATYNSYLIQITERLKDLNIQTDVWGKGLSLETSSVDDLVAQYKLLLNSYKSVREDKNYNVVGSPYASASDERTALQNQYEAIEAELNRRGFNKFGSLLSGSNGGGSGASSTEPKTMRDQLSAAMAALEEFFLLQQKAVDDNYLSEIITATQREKQITELERDELVARIALRRKLLGEKNEFNKEAYEMEAIELDKLAAYIQKTGGKLSAEMSRAAAEDMLKLTEQSVKQRAEIERINLERDLQGNVRRSAQQGLETLGLFWNGAEGDEAAAKERLALLEELARDAYIIEKQGFEERTELNSRFFDATSTLDTSQRAALLVKLQEFNDALIEADRKTYNERKRILDQLWNASGAAATFSGLNAQVDAAEGVDARAQRYGGMTDRDTFESGMSAELMRIQLAEEEYAAMHSLYVAHAADKEMFDELEMDRNAKLQDSRDKMNDHYMKYMQSQIEIGQKWGTALGEGLGEMIAGTEDAGKQLVKNLANMAVQALAQMAQMAVIEAAIGQQNTANSEQNAKDQAATGAKSMLATMFSSIGSMSAQALAQPDSVATFGGTGVARIAIISGLIAAATAAATAGINALFPGSANESASTSAIKKQRLTTGMLTYDEGNIQQSMSSRMSVLGDDGRTYSAQVLPKLQSGLITSPTATMVNGQPALVGERGPELVVGRETTRALMMSRPDIMRALIGFDSMHSGKGWRTYDTGNAQQFAGGTAMSGQSQEQMQAAVTSALAPMMNSLNEVLLAQADAQNRLTAQLNKPITAKINKYGSGGLVEEVLDGVETMSKQGLDPRARRVYRG